MRSFKKTKFKIINKFLIMFLMISMLLISCSANKVAEEQTDEDTHIIQKNETVPTESLIPEDQSSDTLRLYLKKRNHYNPLNAFDYTGRAANRLLYRSLFIPDSGNVLRMDLAEQAKFIPEKNLYEINLIKGINFSNNQLIKAEDCRASILAYRDYLSDFLNSSSSQPETENMNVSLYEKGVPEIISRSLLENELEILKKITEIKLTDDYSLEIILTSDDQESISSNTNEEKEAENATSYSDPGLLFVLTMPILRVDDIHQNGFSDVTSGHYQVIQQDENSISLAASDPQFSLQKIDLKIYDDSVAAMRALEDNQLDAVYLAEDDYNLYGKQNLSQMISFPGQRYFYISFGKGSTINDSANKTALREIWQVRDDIAQLISGYQAISQLPFQFDDAALSDLNLLENKADISLNRKEIQSFRNQNMKFTLITPDSTTGKEWALMLRESLLSLNVQIEIIEIPSDQYVEALTEKQYDLAINWIDIPYPMSIDQTFSLIKPDLFSDLSSEDEILRRQIHQYFYTPNRQFDSKLMDENVFKYRDFIQRYFNQLDILGIGFEQVGIILSNRVVGIPKSTIANPYAELEDLWVWH